ncbi:MAG: 3-methyl-2-oxobutanoate hydroxymethyltransferase [Candidatus Margulisiibacteriota bacterium]
MANFKEKNRKVTVSLLKKLKQRRQKISALTAYDYPFAKILDSAGIDVILVGDSLGNVVLGYENTLPVTMEEILHHLKAVRRGVKRALLVADFPLQGFARQPFKNAKRLMAAGAEAIKIEGVRHLALIRQCLKAGIPVMGHIGFTPQDIKKFGRPRIVGKTPAEEKVLLQQAILLKKTGVFALVLECVPPAVAKKITAAVKIPTIGCGAGPYTDGQILVLYDILGLTQGKSPCFAKQYVNLSELTKAAVKKYIRGIKR